MVIVHSCMHRVGFDRFVYRFCLFLLVKYTFFLKIIYHSFKKFKILCCLCDIYIALQLTASQVGLFLCTACTHICLLSFLWSGRPVVARFQHQFIKRALYFNNRFVGKMRVLLRGFYTVMSK